MDGTSSFKTKFGDINTTGYSDITLSCTITATNFPLPSRLYVKEYWSYDKSNSTFDIAFYDNLIENQQYSLYDIPLSYNWDDNDNDLQIEFVLQQYNAVEPPPTVYVDDIEIRGTLIATATPTAIPTSSPTSSPTSDGDTNSISALSWVLIVLCSVVLVIGTVLCCVGLRIYKRQREELTDMHSLHGAQQSLQLGGTEPGTTTNFEENEINEENTKENPLSSRNGRSVTNVMEEGTNQHVGRSVTTMSADSMYADYAPEDDENDGMTTGGGTMGNDEGYQQ